MYYFVFGPILINTCNYFKLEKMAKIHCCKTCKIKTKTLETYIIYYFILHV